MRRILQVVFRKIIVKLDRKKINGLQFAPPELESAIAMWYFGQSYQSKPMKKSKPDRTARPASKAVRRIGCFVIPALLSLLTACEKPTAEKQQALREAEVALPAAPDNEHVQEAPRGPGFDISGEWYAMTDSGYQRGIVFEQNGFEVTGELDDGILHGTIEGTDIRLEMEGSDLDAVCSYKDGQLIGTYSCPDEGISDEGWSAERETGKPDEQSR